MVTILGIAILSVAWPANECAFMCVVCTVMMLVRVPYEMPVHARARRDVCVCVFVRVCVCMYAASLCFCVRVWRRVLTRACPLHTPI